MKSSLCLAFSLSSLISSSISLPSHSYIRNGHAIAMKHSRALKEIVTPLVRRSYSDELHELEKRSIRRFGTLEFSHHLESRSDGDDGDDSEEGDDDEDCDDETDDGDGTNSITSSSNHTTQNTTVPTYTVPKPKKVPAWNPTEPKKDTPAPAPAPAPAPETKKDNTLSVGVSVSTGSSGGTSIGASTYSGKATFFSQGGVAGACGTVHQDSDYVVAIDSSMYEGGKYCGKTIAVTRVSTGKTIHCIGADECPGCPTFQSLDLSIGAFNALGTPDEGVFDIKWEVVS